MEKLTTKELLMLIAQTEVLIDVGRLPEPFYSYHKMIVEKLSLLILQRPDRVEAQSELSREALPHHINFN